MSDASQTKLAVWAAGLLPGELAGALGLRPAFRGKQVFKWIAKGASSFSEMSDLPAPDRERLSGLPLYSSSVDEALTGADDSVKLKIRLRDGAAVESVLLTDAEGRMTACLSTQVGCPMACAFCKTGALGFLRDLGPDEIVEQYFHLSAIRGRPSNIVFMGMGEPLANIDALRKSIAVLTHPDGLGVSRRKITISTCGVVPGIRELADNGPHVRLAVSLTAATDDLRSALMPVNRSWNLAALKEALLYYQEKTGDRITLEAAIMGGQNSSVESAAAMAEWIRPLNAQVNVIPWNPVPGLPYHEPSRAEASAFEAELERRGVNAVRRARRGRGVSGACGQLGDTLGASLLAEEDEEDEEE
ncbi:MAG: 23S rRNA (adenine(2503)-C(2))-methyltransferase RlmN [Spirochaetes bacterium]|nr:23S rRNA (adenine(2503)-C(2))-methyltransferase RlmN [Spirochaetota bacterium]MBU1079279.1 23S rRNA (adenine(2503)-C(2))-methyltransferase RlmN [Spirochaetota bacterium]